MTIDRKIFFAGVRTALFSGLLSQSQVNGMEAVLDLWESAKMQDVRVLAYLLATEYHETGRAMIPVREVGLGRGHDYGLPAGPYGLVYYGRGPVQLTFYANYQKATAALVKRGFAVDLVKNPDDALKNDIGAAILVYGCTEGWFTGKKLGDYFTPTLEDPINARRVVNGTDKATDIAGYYRNFRTVLVSASAAAQPAPQPAPLVTRPVVITPAPTSTTTSAEKQKKTFLESLRDLFPGRSA